MCIQRLQYGTLEFLRRCVKLDFSQAGTRAVEAERMKAMRRSGALPSRLTACAQHRLLSAGSHRPVDA